ncbi:agmatine deiminase family protein [Bacterioplanoides sp. SCSIO 12839]|uniref:agmatine deiminase family protein n=1 Tax=Bacterioplanoides sp. SCSIO 12839 TaxID=2829569 RepID=UPI002104BBFD|nr:agmatine deiminase family protein [Bacterioplanoides sp. SCSIO 12839]
MSQLNNTLNPQSPLRMPAEWESQQAAQLTWPQQQSDWETVFSRVEPVFHAIVAAISNHQKVIIACGNSTDYKRLTHYYSNMANVVIFRVDSEDTWARDHGPISCYENNRLLLRDFQFNGWGNKYAHQNDNQITQKLNTLNAFGKTNLQASNWVLEGGSLESDGHGTLLTTSQCLLNPNRNPGLSKEQIEDKLKQELGFSRILWLEHGHLEGDDTDAHIDTLARFCSANSIAYCQASPSDDHFESLNAMEQELRQLRTQDGEPYQLIPLPLPSAQYNDDGDRLPATYANFLVINDAVLLPIYGVNEDQLAVEQIANAFPNRKIYPINCRPVIEQFGSLHCLTMQIHTEISTQYTTKC